MKLFMGASMFAIFATVAAAQAEITIGVNLSSTGPAASLGIPEKNAMSFAPSVISGEKVRYVIYDDGSDTTTAVQNVKRLISEEHIDLLIGPTTTPTSLAVIDAAAESRTPVLCVASASAIVSPVDAKRRWMFKVTANDDVYNSAMVNHMAKKGIKTVSVIAVDDPYGEANYQSYKKLAEQKGIRTLGVEKFKRTDTTATAQVLHTMKGNPDAVFIVAAGTPAAMPHHALIERGYKGKIYQTGGVANADFLRVGGKDLEGSFLPASPVLVAEQLPDSYPAKKEALEFVKSYEAKYGPRSLFASLAWNAQKFVEAVVPKALKSAKPGTESFRAALRDAIEQTRGLKAAGAVYTLSSTDHSGVNQLGMCMIRVENGKWRLEDLADYR